MHQIGKHLLCLASHKLYVLTVGREHIKIAEALHTQKSITFRHDRKAQIGKLLSDLTNAMFGVKSTSNNDIIKTINSSTQQIINRISEAEETIVKRSTNISVAYEYGAAVDKFYSAADLYRSFLETASDDGTIGENAL